MPVVKYARRAELDIDGIIGYIAKDNRLAAEDFAAQLVGKVYVIAETPLIGRERDDFGGGVRVFPFGNYIIFYRPTDVGVTILRVLHGARNLSDAYRS